MNPSKLLKASQLANLLCVSEGYVRRHTGRGDLPCVKLPGRLVRYDLDAIKAAFRRGDEAAAALAIPILPSRRKGRWV